MRVQHGVQRVKIVLKMLACIGCQTQTTSRIGGRLIPVRNQEPRHDVHDAVGARWQLGIHGFKPQIEYSQKLAHRRSAFRALPRELAVHSENG